MTSQFEDSRLLDGFDGKEIQISTSGIIRVGGGTQIIQSNIRAKYGIIYLNF